MRNRWTKNKPLLVVSVFAVIVGVTFFYQKDLAPTSEQSTEVDRNPGSVVKAMPTEDITQRFRGVNPPSSQQVSQTLGRENRPLHTPSPEMSLMSRSPDVAGTPEQNLIAATHYVPSMLTPPDQPDLMVAKPAPIPIKEIIEKRQRIAHGERLYQRVVIKAPEGNHLPGGGREASAKAGSNDI